MKKLLSMLLVGGLLSGMLVSCQPTEAVQLGRGNDALFQASVQDRYKDEEKYFHKLEMVKAQGSTYARDLLPKRLQEKYDQLDLHVHSFVPEMNHLELTHDEVKQVMEHYRSDNPQVFWLSGNYEYRLDHKTNMVDQIILSFSYTDSRTQDKIQLTQKNIEEKNRQMKQEADAMIARVPEKASIYEIVLFFHDELVKNVVYDTEAPFQHTLYGALVEKKAVCDGYATAMQYLLGRVGIECIMVYGSDGENEGENHAWNMVKIEDEYYHLDVTWNLPPENSDIPIYVNFLADQKQIEQRHVILSPIIGTSSNEFAHLPAIPKATSSNKWYYRYHDLCISDISDDSFQRLGKKVESAISRQDSYIQFYFENKKDFNKFIREVQTPMNRIAKYLPVDGYYEMTVSSSPENNIVMFIFEYR